MNQKKILILNGSPRPNGNSAVLSAEFQAGAESAGASVEIVRLHDLNINPCEHCDHCRGVREGECTIDDDMQSLYPRLLAADVIVIASPVYWFNFTAQLKLCMDRWYALDQYAGGKHGLTGKKFGLILVYGDSDPLGSGAINPIHIMKDISSYIGSPLETPLHASASDAGEVRNQPEVMEKAFQLGKKLGGAA